MKKREFLAMGGAVPLMLAGCGGDSTGSAPVRLVNASVGYSSLGFMVDTTQATSADVAYGAASPFETVQAGSVTTALTVTSGSTVTSVSSTTRTLSKDSRYSLIAYGFASELKSVLLPESTTTPDTGKANINILNTSVDVGSVDVYVSQTSGSDLSLATLIASSVGGVTTSSFFSLLPGSYYITVVGANSVAEGKSDFRFQSSSAVTVKALQIITVILTPGTSGTLANAIVLTQGTASDTGAVSFLNSTARIRAATAVPASTTVSVISNSTSTPVTVLAATAASEYSPYAVVTTGAPPTVTVDGTEVAVTGSLTTLAAGGDYTLLIYTDASGANPVVTMIKDDNTAPVSTSGVKFRLINLAYNNRTLSLGMTVNGLTVASGVTFGTASVYQEVTTPQTTNSVVEILSGATELKSRSLVLTAGNSFTEVVAFYDPTVTAQPVQDFFSAAVIG